MTEKRFVLNLNSDWWTISDNTTDNERLWGQEIVDLMNELAEENNDLKKANEILMSLCEANNIL